MIDQADVVAYVLADLVLILVAAGIMARAAAALRQPRVVGEIAAGILLGPTLLGGHVGTGSTAGAGLVDRLYPPEAFAFLSLIGQIGLVLYMFLVGIELDRRLLRGRRGQICLVAAAAAAAPIALGFVAAPLFDSSTWRPAGVGDLTFSLFLAAGLAATALPVLARLLQEKGLIATPVGIITVGVAGLVTVVAFLLVAAEASTHKSLRSLGASMRRLGECDDTDRSISIQRDSRADSGSCAHQSGSIAVLRTTSKMSRVSTCSTSSRAVRSSSTSVRKRSVSGTATWTR